MGSPECRSGKVECRRQYKTEGARQTIEKVKFMKRFERDAGVFQMNMFGERHWEVRGFWVLLSK